MTWLRSPWTSAAPCWRLVSQMPPRDAPQMLPGCFPDVPIPASPRCPKDGSSIYRCILNDSPWCLPPCCFLDNFWLMVPPPRFLLHELSFMISPSWFLLQTLLHESSFTTAPSWSLFYGSSFMVAPCQDSSFMIPPPWFLPRGFSSMILNPWVLVKVSSSRTTSWFLTQMISKMCSSKKQCWGLPLKLWFHFEWFDSMLVRFSMVWFHVGFIVFLMVCFHSGPMVVRTFLVDFLMAWFRFGAMLVPFPMVWFHFDSISHGLVRFWFHSYGLVLFGLNLGSTD